MGTRRQLEPASTSWRNYVHEVIFEASTFQGRIFDIALLVAILASIAAISLETVDSVNANYAGALEIAEWTFTVLFTIEYILRIVCVKNPWRYIFSFYGLVDLISILPSYVGFMFSGGNGSFAIVRSFRLLRAFRILKLGGLLSDAHFLTNAVWQSRGKIVVFLAAIVIVVTIAGTLMYEIESRADNEKFDSIPSSIYWAIVTMTTVGYGDIVAISTAGKFVTSILILVGYSMIIVPTGFMSAELVASRLTRKVTNRSCQECLHEDHDPHARYCNQCGTELKK